MAKFGYHDKRLCGFAQNVNHHIGIQKEPVIINLRGVNEMASDYYPLYSYANIGKIKPLTNKDSENRSISWAIYSLLPLTSQSLFTSYKLQVLL